MKRTAVAALMLLASLAAVPAFADADDDKWVAVCMKDNAGASVGTDVVKKYCVCMNNKMDSNETRTITQWEKANPNARKACEAAAGWN